MSKTKLNITFHNPNTPEETAKALIHIFAENLAYTAVYHPEKLIGDALSPQTDKRLEIA